ncbi:MAG TPA: glycosyltransferase family 1 protein [Vicinamibacteria bacterium]
MLLGFDATTIRGNKTGVGYYSARLLERLTSVGGDDNPIDQILVLSNRELELDPIPRCRVVEDGRFPLRAVWMQTILPRILERVRPDLCHFTNFLGPRFTSTPYVVTFHDMTLELLPECHTWKKRSLTRALSPRIARGARLIITPSLSAKQDVSRLLGIPAGKIRAIPHAPDPRFRPDRNRESIERIESRYGIRLPYLLYVGTLEPRKNLERAVTAFSQISPKYPEHSFYLAGDVGWGTKELLRRIESLPNRERVARLGYVAEEDLPALYSNAELFVYPSLYEGFGFPVVEAMACGAPVVTSSTSSLAEIAEGAALLVDPRDTRAIADAMDRALGDEREWARLRLAGVARAGSFSWERSTRETLEVYQEALERQTVRPRYAPHGSPSPQLAARAVLDTIAYGAVFDYPMTLTEIHRSLMGVSLTRAEISRLLRQHPLVLENVDADPPYHFLKGRHSSIESRHEAVRSTRELLAREENAIDLVRRTPFVRMVAFSGATAHENSRDGDVDLFVVTARERAWAVALILFLAMKFLGRRRTICLNYFLAEDRLALAEQDAFTASQIASLKPVSGRAFLYRLVRANEWGASFFPNFWQRYRSLVASSADEPEAGSLFWEAVLSLGGGFPLERLGRVVLGTHLKRQLRASPAGSSVKLEPGVLKLHFKDHGPELSRQMHAPPPPLGEEELDTEVLTETRSHVSTV